MLPDGDASHVLIVDPIDGTRPAMAGLESACVAVAIAPLGEGEPAMRDLEAGCVLEIKTGDWFLAARGRGLQSSLPARVSANTDIGRMFWGYGFRGRPAAATVEVLAGADRRLLGRRRDLRARLAGVRDDPGGDRPARRRGRSRQPHDRRGPRPAGGVRADRRGPGAEQLPVRPGGGMAVRGRGRRGGERRLGRAARPPPAARLRPRVPDVVDHRRLPRAPRRARASGRCRESPGYGRQQADTVLTKP